MTTVHVHIERLLLDAAETVRPDALSDALADELGATLAVAPLHPLTGPVGLATDGQRVRSMSTQSSPTSTSIGRAAAQAIAPLVSHE
jgi:hypothetical protein